MDSRYQKKLRELSTTTDQQPILDILLRHGVSDVEVTKTKGTARCRCCGRDIPPGHDVLRFRWYTPAMENLGARKGKPCYVHLHDCVALRPSIDEIRAASRRYQTDYKDRKKRIKAEMKA